MKSSSPRILVTGISAIHGWSIFLRLCAQFGLGNVFGVRSPKMVVPSGTNTRSLCITDIDGLKQIKSDFDPTHVVHAAGVCDLDVCEERPGWAARLNTGGAQAVAEVFGDSAYLLGVSTDLVFSGINPPPTGYSELSPCDPVSVAGATMARAEEYIQTVPRWGIVRIGLPIGNSVTGDKGAQDWIESRFKKRLPVTLFYDEWRSVIECEELADKIAALVSAEAVGIYHCGGPGGISLYEIGQYVLSRGQYPPALLKGILRKDEIDGPPRICNVTLDSSKLDLYLNLPPAETIRYQSWYRDRFKHIFKEDQKIIARKETVCV